MKRGSWLLLVEDNADDELLMHRALKNQGIDAPLVTASDGARALEILRDRHGAGGGYDSLPRLVLLDLNLPKVSGLEVLERIRGDERTRLLSVVVFTTSGNEIDIERSYAAGVSSYVRKPVCSSAFENAVRNIGRYWLALNQIPLALTG
jgi:two-component system response regulator